MYVGIDVGAESLHCVKVDRRLRIASVGLFGSNELDRLCEWVGDANTVAIDAPAELSTAPHAEDTDLSPKFRAARCAEIDLGRRYGSWVPWVAPPEPPSTGWIAAGLAVHAALKKRGVVTIEVFPHAGFRELAGPARLPKKRTSAGIRARADALLRAGIEGANLLMWSHDGLDALLSALVAHDCGQGTARKAGCEHDDSAIWLPARRKPPA